MAQTNIKTRPEQAQALRLYALQLSARVGRRVSMGEALVVAVTVADRHQAESDAMATGQAITEPAGRPARSRKGGRS